MRTFFLKKIYNWYLYLPYLCIYSKIKNLLIHQPDNFKNTKNILSYSSFSKHIFFLFLSTHFFSIYKP